MAKRKKTGGRVAGTPNRATSEVKAFAEALISRPAYVAQLERSFDLGTADVKLQVLFWHYAKGQPTHKVDATLKLTLEELVTGQRREDH